MMLEGRTAVISGAARGIGRAVAQRLAGEGAAVVILDLDGPTAQRTADGIVEAGGRALAVECDISQTDQVDAAVAAALSTFGTVDVLHNNAYVLGRGRAHELDPADWQRTIDVCLTAYWYTTKAVLGPMLDQGKGSIINTASIAGLAADHELCAYSAAKAGVVNLTRNIGIDYARKGIRCNAICPGPIWTFSQRTFDELDPELAAGLLRATPMRRLGRPAEVAELALFLASDESSFMTGAICPIDGGMFAQTGMPSISGVGPL
jgi:meso-butanediol dehydrogenase/(S,S)-butanediol dehydrogenase/diacetyl reductase